jgi:hypothetical protein
MHRETPAIQALSFLPCRAASIPAATKPPPPSSATSVRRHIGSRTLPWPPPERLPNRPWAGSRSGCSDWWHCCFERRETSRLRPSPQIFSIFKNHMAYPARNVIDSAYLPAFWSLRFPSLCAVFPRGSYSGLHLSLGTRPDRGAVFCHRRPARPPRWTPRQHWIAPQVTPPSPSRASLRRAPIPHWWKC